MRRSTIDSGIGGAITAVFVVIVLGIWLGPAGAQDSPDEGKDGPGAITNSSLIALADEIEGVQGGLNDVGPGLSAVPDFLPVVGDAVVVDITVSGDVDEALARLTEFGLRNGQSFNNLISGRLPLNLIREVEEVDGVQAVLPAAAARNVGSTTAQSDASIRADEARSALGIDGSGVTVGTLSDSYNCLGGEAADIASGDLPNNVDVLAELSDCLIAIDEGRAMIQIIHDIAPGADQQFHTAFEGQADFANGILELAAAGSDVINDDIIYFAEPFFQDGIIAQAAEQVSQQGVPYFSSAGNFGRQSYEAPFRDSGSVDPVFGSPSHDFNAGAGVDDRQRVTVPAGESFNVVLQWSDPFASVTGGVGADTDLDIFFLDTGGNLIASSASTNVGGDPVEILGVTNNGNSAAQLDVVISKFTGPDPALLKYIYFGGNNITINQFATNSDTTWGHSAAASAFSTGAAFYAQTPEFGQSPPLLEPFSSAGPVQIMFSPNGTPVNQLRSKPDITAPDGVDTTFFGFDADANGFPNFFGTSAAAPAAAAATALLLEEVPSATVANVRTALQSTAIDMNGPGFDFNSGAGLIQIDAAIASLAPPTGMCNGLPVTVNLGLGQSPTAGADVILGTPNADVIVGLDGNDTICGGGGNDTINAGPGNDFVDAGLGADTVFGLDGNDTIEGRGGNDTIVGGNGNDTINGNFGNDTLTGGAGADTLNGDEGNDQAFGLGGADTINGGDGNDVLVGDNGPDNINGGDGDDTISGGASDDTLNGNDGDDRIFGSGGPDTIFGGLGNDALFGQTGLDEVFGGNGDDNLFGNESADSLFGGDGNDVINGGPAGDVITGGNGGDTIFGDGDVTQAGNDTINGGPGQDTILGFAGNDSINARDGLQDTVNGGPGVDNCVVDAAAVTDIVFNCEP